MYLSKTKMGKREPILEAVPSMQTAWAIFYFYLWTAFKVLSGAKKEAWKQQICWNCTLIVIFHEVLQKH